MEPLCLAKTWSLRRQVAKQKYTHIFPLSSGTASVHRSKAPWQRKIASVCIALSESLSLLPESWLCWRSARQVRRQCENNQELVEITSKARQAMEEFGTFRRPYSPVQAAHTADVWLAAIVRLEVAEQKGSLYLTWAAGDHSGDGVKKQSCVPGRNLLGPLPKI